VLPMLLKANESELQTGWELKDQPSRLAIGLARGEAATKQPYLRLYKLGMKFSEGATLWLRYRVPVTIYDQAAAVAFVLKFRWPSDERRQWTYYNEKVILDRNKGEYTLLRTIGGSKNLPSRDELRLVEVGVMTSGNVLQEQMFLELLEISILTRPSACLKSDAWRVDNIRIEARGRDGWRHARLLWELNGPSRQDENEWWSEVTGRVGSCTARYSDQALAEQEWCECEGGRGNFWWNED